MLWRAQSALLVADVHLGKAASFRAAGLALPSGHSRDDLARLSELIACHAVEHLVVLGDLVHNRASYTDALNDAVIAFNRAHPLLKKTLIEGNHDNSAGQCPSRWEFSIHKKDLSINRLVFSHDPLIEAREGEVVIGGHLHPTARLRSLRESVTLPCFWQQARRLILPSFGSLTGGYPVRPAPGDVTYLVTPQQIFRNAHW